MDIELMIFFLIIMAVLGLISLYIIGRMLTELIREVYDFEN